MQKEEEPQRAQRVENRRRKGRKSSIIMDREEVLRIIDEAAR
jgi:hypothetical protein